jgi:hypothetical protein
MDIILLCQGKHQAKLLRENHVRTSPEAGSLTNEEQCQYKAL